ncbi:MAG: hypothetical protein AB8B87_21775 [Granulosicoccus sp.]
MLERICRGGPAGIFPVPHYRQKRPELTDQGRGRYALKSAYRDGATGRGDPLGGNPLGGNPPNSRYRDRVTPIRCGKLKKLSAQENAASRGLKAPILSMR